MQTSLLRVRKLSQSVWLCPVPSLYTITCWRKEENVWWELWRAPCKTRFTSLVNPPTSAMCPRAMVERTVVVMKARWMSSSTRQRLVIAHIAMMWQDDFRPFSYRIIFFISVTVRHTCFSQSLSSTADAAKKIINFNFWMFESRTATSHLIKFFSLLLMPFSWMNTLWHWKPYMVLLCC